MSKKNGTIDLSEVRYISGVIPSDELVSVELLSNDLSDNTTVNPHVSVGGTNFDIARDPIGNNITETLVQSETLYFSFNGKAGDYFKIVFAGATTGNVAYYLNSL